MTFFRLTEGEIARCRELFMKGLPASTIAQRLGRCESTVLRHTRDLAPRRAQKSYDHNTDKLIKTLMDQGLSTREIGLEIGRSKNSVIGRVWRMRRNGKL